MRRSVFPDSDGVMCKHVDDGNFHDGGKTHRRPRVIAEDQKAGAECPNLAEREAVQNGTHGVFAYAEVEISAVIASGFKIACAIEREARLGGGSEIGGAADLAPSTKTRLTFDGAGDFEAGSYNGRNFHFGIREHAMCSILNGLSLSKIRAFGSGFLIFSDYSRPPMRLAAIMEIPVIYVFTHDSIGVGEDGPTHQPVEQLASLRALPGFIVLRPADANEVTEAWRVIMQLHHEPTALILSRQALPTIDRSKYASASGLAKGAYVLADSPGSKPELILMATGSEVSLCLSVYEQLSAEGCKVRVVSMPSREIFENQSAEYRESVLPSGVTARISVEQASTFGWAQYVGHAGKSIGMKTFGASAPLKELQKKFGFTPDAVMAAARELLHG